MNWEPFVRALPRDPLAVLGYLALLGAVVLYVWLRRLRSAGTDPPPVGTIRGRYLLIAYLVTIVLAVLVILAIRGPAERGGDRPTTPVRVEIHVKSESLPVDVLVDAQFRIRLTDDSPSTTLQLSEGSHLLVARKGDRTWERVFDPASTRIILIPSEAQFR